MANNKLITRWRLQLYKCECYVSLKKLILYFSFIMWVNTLTLKYTCLTSPKCARIVVSRAIMLLMYQRHRRQAWTTTARRRYKRLGRGRSTARADSRLSPCVVHTGPHTHAHKPRADVSFFSSLSPFRRSQIRSGPFVRPIYVTRRASLGGGAVSEEGEI